MTSTRPTDPRRPPSPLTGRKRERPHRGGRQPSPAKLPASTERVRTASQCLAVVTHDSDYRRSERNCVWLNPELYGHIFGEDAEEGRFLKVANLVVRALRGAFLKPGHMDVNSILYRQMWDSIIQRGNREKIWISRFDFQSEPPGHISKMRLSVYPGGTLNVFGDTGEPKAVLTSSLERLFRERFDGDVLTLNQELFINHPVVGPIRVKVGQWEQEDCGSPGSFVDQPIPYYGRFDSGTEVKLHSGSRRELILADEIDPSQLERFHFRVHRIRDVSELVFTSGPSPAKASWKNGGQPLPLLLPFSELAERVRRVFGGKKLLLNRTETFQEGGWAYDVKFIRVDTKASGTEKMDVDPDSENVKVFELHPGHHLRIVGNKQVILTDSKEHARKASELTFEIIDLEREVELKENELAWVSVSQVEEAVKSKEPLLVHGCKVVVTINGVKYLLKLVRESGEASQHSDKPSALKEIWQVGEGTRVKVFASGPKLEIVDTDRAYELESIKVTVAKMGDKPRGLMALLTGGDEEGDKTIVKKEELVALFRESLPNSIVHEKMKIQGLTGKGDKVEFRLGNLKRKDRGKHKELYHGCVFRLTPKTKISLEGAKGGDLVISSKPEPLALEDVGEKLRAFGIGGMKDEFKDIIARTILSRSTYASHIASLGKQPSRGLLLYGPPGTGKTLIARKLGELLGVTKERIQLITGSQIWDKYVGESEKKVRKIFEAARADQKRLGDEAPLHLIIIDEIDAFLQQRSSDAKRWETSVVNTFLAELDGISSDGEDSLKNVIVVGLTNHPERLDGAVKRPGRLFPHIHIGIPDSAGRREIFEIHSRGAREGGFLADDVDADEIAKMTVGRTGAFIEGVVTAAAEYSIKRLWEAKVPVEQLHQHPAAKLTMGDFRQAYLECVRSKRKKKKDITRFIPAPQINLKAVSDDLRRLGLAGFNPEVVKFLFDLKVAQHYKKFLYAMNHSFPRGVLFYGSSGCGKTSLAWSVKKLLNLDDQRFHYMTASELWPLRGEYLKSKIEEVLEPARVATEDLKGEAPLHVIVVDELDAMYPYKKETDGYDASVMNQFLMELEPLFDEESRDMHNLLVIGIAHRDQLGLSEGILRHGRLGKHVEVKSPDSEGRKAIFDIYLQKYQEAGLLDPGVDFEELARMTKNCTGAYIEGLVSQSIVRSMQRVAAAGIKPGVAGQVDEAKLRMEDFSRTHQEMRSDTSWQKFYS